MRIRTANGVGFVRLRSALVIVLVLVMSGSAAFGQQKQSARVVQPSVSSGKKSEAVQKPIQKEQDVKTQEEGKTEKPLPPSNWEEYPLNPFTPTGPFMPGVNPFPSGPGGNGSNGGSGSALVLYEDICSCSRSESFTLGVGITVNGTAPADIRAAISQLPSCYGGTRPSESHIENLSYKISEYVVPGRQYETFYMCAHGTIASYELTDTWTYTHCSITDTHNPPNPNPAKFNWTIFYSKTDAGNAQNDVETVFGRCPH